MATQAQIDANRKNAQKSSGPKTPEGKAKSCLNHLSHGFTSSTVFVADEDKEEFNALLADLLNHFNPANPLEQILVEKMVHNHWHSLRAIHFQSGTLSQTVPSGYIHKSLGLLIRYQTAADRAFHKAHTELVKAQKQRANSDNGFESQNAPQPTPDEGESTPQNPPEYTAGPGIIPFEGKLAEDLGVHVHEILTCA